VADNSADIAKRIILGCVAEGMTIEQACASAGISIKTYEYYRRTD
jgi:DNA-binding CsgD family transcriptional regulator